MRILLDDRLRRDDAVGSLLRAHPPTIVPFPEAPASVAVPGPVVLLAGSRAPRECGVLSAPLSGFPLGFHGVYAR